MVQDLFHQSCGIDFRGVMPVIHIAVIETIVPWYREGQAGNACGPQACRQLKVICAPERLLDWGRLEDGLHGAGKGGQENIHFYTHMLQLCQRCH